MSQDRRKHRRVAWITSVKGLCADGVEFEASTVDVCAGGLRVRIGRQLGIGEPLVLYLEDVGRVEGVVVRKLAESDYAVEFRVPGRKRDKIADQLTWLINRDRLGLAEERVAERRSAAGQIIATYGDNQMVACAISDVSVFGVALRTSGQRPMIGDKVTVGERPGTCVRYIEGGFAVDFRPVELLNDC
jgi:hypothetical protein